MSQAITGLFESAVKLVHTLAIGRNSSRVHVGYHFETQVRGAANSLGRQQQRDLSIVSAVHLLLPQLLNNNGGSSYVIHGIAKLIQNTQIDTFQPERFFELLQLHAGFLNL